MDINEIRSDIKESLAKVARTDSDDIPDAMSFRNDLKLDSLAIMEFVIEIEMRFQISVAEEDIPHLDTVSDVIKMVQQNLCTVAN